MMSKPPKRSHPDRNHSRKGYSAHMDSSEDFMFNKTSLLSSALQKLKKKNNNSTPKRVNEEPIPLEG